MRCPTEFPQGPLTSEKWLLHQQENHDWIQLCPLAQSLSPWQNDSKVAGRLEEAEVMLWATTEWVHPDPEIPYRNYLQGPKRKRNLPLGDLVIFSLGRLLPSCSQFVANTLFAGKWEISPSWEFVPSLLGLLVWCRKLCDFKMPASMCMHSIHDQNSLIFFLLVDGI